MSNTNTTRANRPNRDKSAKMHTQNIKDPASQKNQMNKPTPDQLRVARFSDKKAEDTECSKKIAQIKELTNKTEEEIAVALFDCDQDTNRTVNLLLEGGGDQGEWQEMGKKKKKTAQNPHSKQEPMERSERRQNNRDRSDDRDNRDRDEPHDRSESSGRGRRMANIDGPPRFQRAGKVWRGSKENGDSDWNSNRGDRDGNFERGRGRGRGRGGGRGGRGGGFGGGFGGPFQVSAPIEDWGESSEPKTNGFESSPIDTWTNDQAAAKKKNQWGEGEDWNDDDWTGNLTETTVFTARNVTTDTPAKEQEEVNSGADDGFIQNNSMPQSIDLSAILNQKSSEKMDLHAQTNEATESLKSMMGIGTTSSHHYSSVSSLATSMTTGIDSQPSQSIGTMSQSILNQGSMPLQSQRAKPARSKLPPPSKIPNKPVEMPGMAMSMQLDVQFGFGANSTSFGETDQPLGGSFTSNSIGVPMTSMSHNGLSNESGASTVASLSSIVQQRQPSQPVNNMGASPGQHQSIFQNSPDTTPSKDYQTNLMTPPDSYPKQERQPSPRVPSRNPTSLDSDKYAQSAYSPSYQRYAQNGPESDSAKSYQKPQQYQSGFQSSGSFQSQSPNSYSKLGQFQSSNTAPYRGQASYDQSDSSPPGYQSAGQTYAQKPQPTVQTAQNTPYQTGKINYSQQSTLPGPATSTYTSKPSFNQSDQDYNNTQASSTTPYSTASRQNDETYPNSQTGSVYPNSQSSTYQPSASVAYDSSSATSSLSTTGQQTQTSNQSTQYGARTSYASNHTLQTSPISAGKLSEGLGTMTVDDSTMKSNVTYAADTDVGAASTALSAQGSNISLNSSTSSGHLGGLPATASSNASLTGSKLSGSSTTVSKAPPNIPPGVPTVMGPNFIVGQPGMQYYGLQSMAAQQPAVYSYEDFQLLQQRMMSGYYDPSAGAMSFQQTPTSLSGARADQNSIVSNVPQPYQGAQASDNKLNRMDAPSPVQGSQAGQQQTQSAHQQQFINATLAPGYGYYAYPNAGLMPSGPFSYTPTMFQQVPPVTNSAHVPAGTTSSSQYQKPYATSHYAGYEDLVQAQEYGKSGPYHLSQGTKVSAGAAAGIKPITTSTTDLNVNAAYGKSHSQAYEKQGYHHGNTPPPYGVPAGLTSGQSAMAQSAYAAPFMPMHQHSQMMHTPHLHQQVRQDQSGLRPAAQVPNAAKPATGMTKYAPSGYWNTA